jgi:tetratricopeptide (TPR) repeat protein
VVTEYPALRQQLADLIWTRCLAYLDRSQPDGLIAACQQALALDQAAHRKQPDDARSAYNLANSLWLMGEAQRKAGNAAVALPYFQQGEVLARELNKRDPTQARNKNLLAVMLLGRAKAYAKLQQPEPMQTELEAVLDITRPLVVDSGDHLIMHNHVTALILLTRYDEARPWAQELIATGWQRPEFLQLCAQHRLLDSCADSAP